MLNRWIEVTRACSTSSRSRGWAASSSPRSRRGCSTDRYLDGVPADSRAARDDSTIAGLDDESLERVRALNAIAERARPEARPAGAAVGAARRAGDQRGDRGVQRRAARHQPRRARGAAADRRRSWPRSTATPWTRASTSGRSRPEAKRRRECPRRVVVVGADAAGMWAAHQALRTAARSGRELADHGPRRRAATRPTAPAGSRTGWPATSTQRRRPGRPHRRRSTGTAGIDLRLGTEVVAADLARAP